VESNQFRNPKKRQRRSVEQRARHAERQGAYVKWKSMKEQLAQLKKNGPEAEANQLEQQLAQEQARWAEGKWARRSAGQRRRRQEQGRQNREQQADTQLESSVSRSGNVNRPEVLPPSLKEIPVVGGYFPQREVTPRPADVIPTEVIPSASGSHAMQADKHQLKWVESNQFRNPKKRQRRSVEQRARHAERQGAYVKWKSMKEQLAQEQARWAEGKWARRSAGQRRRQERQNREQQADHQPESSGFVPVWQAYMVGEEQQ
jgi:hypothetical protein